MQMKDGALFRFLHQALIVMEGHLILNLYLKRKSKLKIYNLSKSKFVLTIVVLLILSSCQLNKSIGQEIEENLKVLVNNNNLMTSSSSNPNEYIQNNLKSYQNILKTQNEGLNYLTKKLKENNQDGLKEWIMAKACVDILMDKNLVREWATGKEWITQYEKSK
jgi:hypothetical protein